jgi:serine/threonine-protein kinase ULK/ATG1
MSVKRIGNYELTQKLGEGSFALVFRGIHIVSKSEVAVKVIPIEKLGNDPRLHQNLMSEIAIMRDYIHEGICRLFESFSSKSSIYLVLEYCAGGDLQKYIRKNGRLNEYISVRRFLKQLADGLKFLHDKNIIHRDIKSQV